MNTICNATEERQTEAKEIAAKVDAMIIIGGRHSSNTRKLYELSLIHIYPAAWTDRSSGIFLYVPGADHPAPDYEASDHRKRAED